MWVHQVKRLDATNSKRASLSYLNVGLLNGRLPDLFVIVALLEIMNAFLKPPRRSFTSP